MTLKVFLDIETLPPDESVLPVFETKILPHLLTKVEMKEFQEKFNNGNSSKNKSETTAESKEESLKKHYQSLGLRAEYGRILCIGVILEKDGKEWRKGVFGYDIEDEILHTDEAKTLRGFWKMMKEDFNVRHDLIIGHNVMDFDLPFIYKRSRILRIEPTVRLGFARYRSFPIYDTMREWALWNLREKSISLVHLAELLGVKISKTEGIDGSRVYDEFLANNHSLIAEYCLQDVEITRAIYHLMNPINEAT